MTNTEIKQKLIEMGGKEWVQHGKDRVYITCDILNKFSESIGQSTGYNLNESKNKIFYDVDLNSVMRSYKGGKPTIEFRF